MHHFVQILCFVGLKTCRLLPVAETIFLKPKLVCLLYVLHLICKSCYVGVVVCLKFFYNELVLFILFNTICMQIKAGLDMLHMAPHLHKNFHILKCNEGDTNMGWKFYHL